MKQNDQIVAEMTPSGFAPAEGRDIAAILDPASLTIIGAREEGGRIGFATVLWATPVSHNPAMTAFALRAKSHTMSLIQKNGFFSLSTLPADDEGVRLVELCGNNTGHKLNKAEHVEYELIEIECKLDKADFSGTDSVKLSASPEHNETTQRASVQAASAQSAIAQPITAQPAIAQPITAQPASVQPATTQSAIARSTTDQLATSPLLPVPQHALAWELCEVESIQETGDHLLVIGRVLRAASRASRDEKKRLAPTETLLCIQHGAYAPVGDIL